MDKEHSGRGGGAGDAERRWGKLVARAWEDDSLKERLKSSPKDVLDEHGVSVPKGVRVKVVENTPDTIHIVLPANPAHIGAIDEVNIDEIGKRAIVGPDSCSI